MQFFGGAYIGEQSLNQYNEWIACQLIVHMFLETEQLQWDHVTWFLYVHVYLIQQEIMT